VVSRSNKRSTKPFVGPGSLRASPLSEAPEEKLLGIPSKTGCPVDSASEPCFLSEKCRSDPNRCRSLPDVVSPDCSAIAVRVPKSRSERNPASFDIWLFSLSQLGRRPSGLRVQRNRSKPPSSGDERRRDRFSLSVLGLRSRGDVLKTRGRSRLRMPLSALPRLLALPGPSVADAKVRSSDRSVLRRTPCSDCQDMNEKKERAARGLGLCCSSTGKSDGKPAAYRLISEIDPRKTDAMRGWR
jgi:hypothetical protein